MSEWGHDFRPDYRRLRDAAAHCRVGDGAEPSGRRSRRSPRRRRPEVRDDIIALLGLDEPQVLVAGFDRPNIFLRVERVHDEEEKDERLPDLVRGRRALVYAATRETARTRAAAVLRCAGVQRGGLSRRPEG